MTQALTRTLFTHERLYESGLLPPLRIVNNPELLPTVVAHMLARH